MSFRKPWGGPVKTTKERGYDGAWKKIRKFILHRDGYTCKIQYAEICTHMATEVDHIIPIEHAPHRRLDPTNLQAACKPCNIAKENRDRGKFKFKHEL